MGGGFAQIRAAITPLRHRVPLAGVQMAKPDGGGQDVDLESGVVEVIFGGDGVSGAGKDAREGVAVSGAASVSDVEGSGGIGGNEFKVNEFAAGLSAPEVSGIAEDVAQNGGFGFGAKADINKPGPRDLGGENEGRRSPVLQNTLRDLAWGLPQNGREPHRNGRGEVPHFPIIGPLHDNIHLRRRRKGTTSRIKSSGQLKLKINRHGKRIIALFPALSSSCRPQAPRL